MMDTSNLSNFYSSTMSAPLPGDGTEDTGIDSGGSGGIGGEDSGWEWDDPGNTAAPEWMGTGSYAKWWQGSDPEWAESDPDPKQRWWRSPSVGGGIVWHPYWGWQSRSEIKNLYSSDEDNSVSWDEFSGWGLTKQTDQDWRTYFPDATTDSGSSSGSTWTGTLTAGAGTGTGTTSGGDAVADTTTDTSTLGTFTNYPSQWDSSNSILDYLSSYTPWQYDTASATAANTAETGDIVSADPWYQTAVSKGWYDTQDAIKQAAEQAGLGGTRWSSVTGRTAQDIAGRNAANLANEYASRQGQYATDAANRKLTASSLLESLGTDVNNQLFSASSALSDLGSKYAQYPIDLATAASEIGATNAATEQSALDKEYAEALRTMAENNPYLALIYQMATGMGTSQQYNSGQLTNLLGILGQIFMQ
jgi:hypothetical protein